METQNKTETSENQNAEISSTENASKKGAKKSHKGSTKKRNLRNKIARERTTDVFKIAENALNGLAQKNEETKIKDQDIIKRSISKILELKSNGVAMDSIYEVLKTSANLTISVSSFRQYVANYAAEVTGKGKKRISVIVPEEHAKSFIGFATAINRGMPVVCVAFENGKIAGQTHLGKTPQIKVELISQA